MHACIDTRVNACVHSYVYVGIRSTPACIHACLHTCIHTCIPAHTHMRGRTVDLFLRVIISWTCLSSLIRPLCACHPRMHTNICIHIYIHAYVYIHTQGIHTYIHTRSTHSHTRMHIQHTCTHIHAYTRSTCICIHIYTYLFKMCPLCVIRHAERNPRSK